MIHKAYKVTGSGGVPCHGGNGAWTLGEWREETGVTACEPGMLHLCKNSRQLLSWLNAEIYEAEYDDSKLVIDHDDKLAVQRARIVRRVDSWNERTARLFACDCAEMVLPIFERTYPTDRRPHEAIQTARAFANGAASKEQMMDAAWDVAADAAWAAAAAGAAAAAEAAAAAWAAAWAAAGDAAGDAARDKMASMLDAVIGATEKGESNVEMP